MQNLTVYWQTSKRTLDLTSPIVMGILNVTPDSFSDGGRYTSLDAAMRRVGEMIEEGTDIIDIGGESTRPGSQRVSSAEEIDRTAPIIAAIVQRFDVAVSIDTSKSAVAEAALGAGAEIVNDISGLRFDPRIAEVAAKNSAALVLMHSRGDFATMHSQPPVEHVLDEVANGLNDSIAKARSAGITEQHIALDVGIGFAKTDEQNLQLIARLGRIGERFPRLPLVVGASRKSFLGKILDGAAESDRLNASLAAAVIAAWNGARILRVHDVRATREALSVVHRLDLVR